MKRRNCSGYIKQKIKRSNETKNNIASENFQADMNNPNVRRKNRKKLIDDCKDFYFEYECKLAECKQKSRKTAENKCFGTKVSGF